MTSPEPEKAVPVVAARLRARLQKEADRRNSAYDYYGMDNTPQTVDADLFALLEMIRLTDHEAAMAALRAEVERLRADAERCRHALALAVDHIDMGALRISHCKDAAAITAAHGAQGDSNAE